MRRTAILATAAIAALLPTLAHAQNDGPQADTVFDGDYLTVGVGGFYGPSYEGSDDYILFPAPVIQGNLKGVAITPRPGGVALDFIPDAKDAKVGFSLGPVANIRRDRVTRIKDPVVRRLGKLDTAVEVGGSAGVTVYDLPTPATTRFFPRTSSNRTGRNFAHAHGSFGSAGCGAELSTSERS